MFPQLRKASALVALTSAASVLARPHLNTRATQASTDLCGDYDNIILNNTPWIVYNMLYNAKLIEGSQCTYYDSVITGSDGTKEVKWNSETDITYVESTNNVPKGYSFVGLTQNLETKLTGIASIPTTYTWTRSNTTAFKGNVCYDFMTNDVKGDSTSASSQELMLWLQYEGGQLPIGWAAGSVATIDNLFGTSWDLYQGKNDDTGITVSSLLPKTQFQGTFKGDLREWLVALAGQGLFTENTYVNVGNAGTEFFYGNAVLNATLGLQIDLGTPSTSPAVKAVVAPSSSATSTPPASSAPVSLPVSSTTAAESAPAVTTPAYSYSSSALPSTTDLPSPSSSPSSTSTHHPTTKSHHVPTPSAPSSITPTTSASATTSAITAEPTSSYGDDGEGEGEGEGEDDECAI